MKTIIVTPDFSPTATNAMNYAADMALQLNASLLLFHVYQMPVMLTDAQIIMLSVDELRDSAEQQMKETKEKLAHITSGRLKIYTETVMGHVTDELKILCEKISPFAIVAGTKGLSAVERTLFGSNTLSFIKHLSWPVICVPQGKEYGKGIQKAGLACDFREVVDTIPLKTIENFISTTGAALHVLNVDYNNKRFSPDTPEQSLLLHTALEKLNPQYHFIEHEDIEDGINEFAEKNNLDLIITVPRKHKLLESLFKPSSTRQLVFQSHIPVMCVHE